MKDRLIGLMIIVLISMTAVGCSAVRLASTRAGVGVKKIPGASEERRTESSKRDFQLGFNTTGNRLGIRLEYRPYYRIEKQQTMTHRPEKSSTGEILIGVAYTGLLIWVLSDILVETGEVAVNDEGELYDVTEFDWDRATPTQQAITAGIAADTLLWLLANQKDVTVRGPWKWTSEVAGQWQYMRNHPYRVELPTYNFGKDYQSQTGNESLLVREFLTGIGNPTSFMDIDSVSLRASTEFEGKAYQKHLRFTNQSQLQPFREVALAAKGIDMSSTGKPRLMPRPEVTFRWNKNAVRAGTEATLWVTVKNTGKGTLYRLTALTISPDSTLNNRELKFGKIDPGDSIAIPVSFNIDKLKRAQNIPIRIRFAEYNDHAPRNVESVLRVVENPRPKFDYAYRVVDGGTATSVGNGDGILQRGESADILVTIRNSGEGNAAGVTARLNLLDRAGVDIYGDTFANLYNLAPGDSKTATFNVGVKGNASIRQLRLNLSVEENNFGSETKLTKTFNLTIGQGTAPKVRFMDLVATVTSNSAQVYNGAASSTPISAEIPQSSQVKVSGQLGEWYRVEFNIRDQELTGWVHEAQLTTEDTSRPPSPEVEKPAVVEVFQNTPPTLAVFEPAQKQIEVEDRILSLQALAVANAGIKRVELTVNGKTKNITRRGKNTTQRTPSTALKIEENVLLNYGENTIRLRAFDTDNMASEAIVLSVTRKREEVRNDYALLFGVNSYEHFDPWHKLNNPIPDAEAIGNELKNRYGFAVEVVSDPSRDKILTKINQYARRQYNDNDQLLIFFAGHGYYEERNNIDIGYLVASDTLPPEADRGKSSYISHGDLRERIENIGCEHIFLMVDACFSGAFDVPVDQFNRERDRAAIPDDIPRPEFIKQTLAYKTRWYLTSGGKAYVSDSRPNQHSPFTRRVLEALRSSRRQDGILTLDDICHYAEKVVPQPRVGEFGMNALGSNFLFIRE